MCISDFDCKYNHFSNTKNIIVKNLNYFDNISHKFNLRDRKNNKRLNLKKLVSVIGYETREEQRLTEANAHAGLLKSISKLTIFFCVCWILG